MLTCLNAEHFKSWSRTQSVPLAPITALFGANSSGKTSLLQLLLMLKQTAASQDRKRVLDTGDEYTAVELGTFYDLIHNHNTKTSLDLGLSWDLDEPLEIKDPERKSAIQYSTDELNFRCSIRELSGRMVVDWFVYTFGKRAFGMERSETDRQPNLGSRYELVASGFKPRRVRGRPWPLPPPIKCYGFPNEVLAYYTNTGFLSDLSLAFERMCDRVLYLGPLRDDPFRTYRWSGDRPVDVGARGESAIQALLAARDEGLESGRGKGRARRYAPIQQRILEWLRKAGMLHGLKLERIARNRQDYELRVQQAPNGPEVNVVDVGFGVSQVLPVLVLCYYAPESSTIILEQPEIHLHPAVQSTLADVFIDVALERGVQIIFESHSEHLLRRLQRRVADGRLRNSDVAIYFCEMHDGGSKIERLEVDEYGSVLNWPRDFFGDQLGEMAAIGEGSLSRRVGRKK